MPFAAAAGPPGKWDVVTRGKQSGVAPLGVVRTADGTLHVLWHRATSPATSDVLHTAISPSGQVRASTPVVSGWPSVNGVALALRGSELLAFFTGMHKTTRELGLHVSMSRDGGRTWSPPTTAAVTDFVYSRVPSVAVPGGDVLEAWYAVGEPVVHVGLDPGPEGQRTPTHELSPPGTSVNIVSDATRTYVAWCSASKGRYGVWVRQVDPTSGAPVGVAARMPGSTVKQNGAAYLICPIVDYRIGLTARQGGGVYTAVFTRGGVQPTDSRVVVWRVGDGVLLNAVRSPSVRENVSLAADADGHVWVGWTEGTTLYASRSNKAGTHFGPLVSAKAPAGQAESTVLNLSAQSDRLDALVTYDTGGNAATRINVFHTQLNPGLTLARTVAGDRHVRRHRRRRPGRRSDGSRRQQAGDDGRERQGVDRPAARDLHRNRLEGELRAGRSVGAGDGALSEPRGWPHEQAAARGDLALTGVRPAGIEPATFRSGGERSIP